MYRIYNKEKLKWYVLNGDFNRDLIYQYNIFDNSRFYDDVIKLVKKYSTYDEFKEKLTSELKYNFMSRAEYEIDCKNLFGEKEYKISVYDQLEKNIDVLCNYILNEFKKH